MTSFRYLIYLLVLFNTVSAQTNRFSLKPAIGLTASQVHGDTYSGYHKLGFMGGLFVNAPLNKKTLSAELGIIFIQKGSRKNQNPDKGDYSYYYLNLNYVEVPVVLRFAVKKYFITFGGSVGYLINYHEESDAGNLTGKFPFESFEYSFNIGLGRELGEKMSVEVRSNNSFISIRSFGSNFKPYYPNPLARQFNDGYYSNILEVILSYKISSKKKGNTVEKT